MLGGGRPLNRVQERAVELLLLRQARDEQFERGEATKRALLSADKTLYPVLYPSENEVAVTEKTVQEDLADTEGGQWKFEQGISPMEAEKILAGLAAQTGGTLRMQDLEQEGDGDDW